MDSYLTEHPLGDRGDSKKQQIFCKPYDEKWVASVLANHCLITANPVAWPGKAALTEPCFVFRGYEVGDLLCVRVVRLRPCSQGVSYH